MRVTVSTAAWEKARRAEVADLLARAESRAKITPAEAARRLRAVLGSSAPTPGMPGWAKAADTALYDAYQREEDLDARTAIMKLMLALEDVDTTSAQRRREYASAIRAEVAQARSMASAVGRAVTAAVRRVPRWGGSAVRVETYGSPGSFKVEVGPASAWQTPAFTLFTDDAGAVTSVDDVLEGGDTDFFEDPKVQADYFNLVKELRKPGSSSTGRNLVLWTARPVRDRARYEKAATVPPNIFLTTSPDRACGLAQEGELGGGVRDVWRVVVNEADVVMTLETDRLRDYQTVGTKPIKVKSLSLVYPAQRENPRSPCPRSTPPARARPRSPRRVARRR